MKILYDWLNSLGEGERSCFIRQALRKALIQKDEFHLLNEKEILDSIQLTNSVPNPKTFNSGISRI